MKGSLGVSPDTTLGADGPNLNHDALGRLEQQNTNVKDIPEKDLFDSATGLDGNSPNIFQGSITVSFIPSACIVLRMIENSGSMVPDSVCLSTS